MAQNLAKILMDNMNGATFIGLSTKTAPKLTGGKKNPHQGRVAKIQQRSNVMLFQNKSANGYNNMVLRRLEKEGKDPSSFSLQPRRWGTRINGTPFIEHNGNYYVEVIFLHAGDVHYTLDEKVVDPALIEGMPVRRSESEQGGLEDKVIIRTFSVESITSVQVNHKSYDDLYFDVDEVL